jgi:CubicO group peptidase (beta-lactamase class C family)
VLIHGTVSAAIQHDVPTTTDTMFDAGSVSKHFTAAAVVRSARAGKLSLDDSVRKYVPELPDFGVPLTIRHLLHYTSGLRLGAIWLVSRTLNFPPGTRWSYTNAGYNRAAITLSRVGGKDYTRIVKHRAIACSDRRRYAPGLHLNTYKATTVSRVHSDWVVFARRAGQAISVSIN